MGNGFPVIESAAENFVPDSAPGFIDQFMQDYVNNIETGSDDYVPPAVPSQALVATTTSIAQLIIEGNVDTSDQDALDSFFHGNNVFLQTEKYNHSQYAPSGITIRSYLTGEMEDGNIATMGAEYITDRTWYTHTGGGVNAAGGGAVGLDVGFLASPLQAAGYESDMFEIEPVLRAGFLPALRPGHLSTSIQSHADRYATMRVMSIDKKVIYATTNFMMQGYSKASKESFKVIESTVGNSLHFNREKYKLMTVSLAMVDAKAPFDWLRAWEENWNNIFRGSVLSKNKWRWYLLYSGRMIGGYPVQYTVTANAQNEPNAAVSMDIFITDDIPLPDMKMITSESGLSYFKWDGAYYSSGEIELETQIKDRFAPARVASKSEETEYTAET